MSLLAIVRGRNAVAKSFLPKRNQVRSFWEYVNMMFNKPDPKRIELVGPDRACAEWVLRNGGKVVWEGGRKLADYNSLPSEEEGVPQLVEIDGSDSSISHYGFPHLSGCTKLKKIILHNDNYIDDRAIKGLSYGKSTLTHVQVSKCGSVTDTGVREIKILDKLETLVLFDLQGVTNLDECKQFLQLQLPKCKIQDDAEYIKH
ncbi:ATP synthase subunit s, mitochondrial isoform X1 [Plodia interpunctella]|uniref:ATP synthase subunit s, mitochondrial isoform X1 n=2 Tax=Plodia interpunctella TaxID=58824 RepID=UPI00236806B6|nr:ATP synthase subunit s, mitochondrial [Plodia interpunctella]XP_053604835.1 ATP synthase subunit s, mitochondrial [Plodia interpunctella]